MLSSSAIDEAILSVVGQHWKKVAMVIFEVAKAIGKGLPDDDEGYRVISDRIQSLVESNLLTVQGDTRKWRHSEVRRGS